MRRPRPPGRRRVFLLMFGAIYLVFGATILLLPNPRFADIGGWLGAALDAPAWGAMWIGGGLVATLVAARAGQGRDDGAGFVALLVPPALWTMFYLISYAVWLFSGGLFGQARSLSGVLVWSIAWTVVMLVSGWPDPDATNPEGRR